MLQEDRRHRLRQLSEGLEDYQDRDPVDVAGDPSVPPDDLRDLFDFGFGFDRETYQGILRALAGNPSTPPDLLVQHLAGSYPEEFLANPALGLLLLENPQLLQALSRHAFLGLVSTSAGQRMLGKRQRYTFTQAHKAASRYHDSRQMTLRQLPRVLEIYQTGAIHIEPPLHGASWHQSTDGLIAELNGSWPSARSIDFSDLLDLADQAPAKKREAKISELLDF